MLCNDLEIYGKALTFTIKFSENFSHYPSIGKQETYGPHRSPEKPFRSINAFAQTFVYAFTMTLIKRSKSSFPFEDCNGDLFAKNDCTSHNVDLC